jgi:hypothetical protein
MIILLAGAESVPQLTSCRVAGYRRSHRGNNNAHLFVQSCTLQTRHLNSLNCSINGSILPLCAASILHQPRNNFHELSRANGPVGHLRRFVVLEYLVRRLRIQILMFLRTARLRFRGRSGYLLILRFTPRGV